MGDGNDPTEQIQASRQLSFESFDEQVREEAAIVKEHLEDGTFDNEQVTIGLEHEFYAVDSDTGQIRRLPRGLLGYLGFEKELGLHNAELASGVYPCNHPGLTALSKEVEAKLSALHDRAVSEDIRLVSDGLWTIGPEYNSTDGYLMEATHEEGLTLAINVSNAVRYHGFASSPREPAFHVDLPEATIDTDAPGPVSLTTSIQPHYQCRSAAALPAHFRSATRLAGPLLALGVNSPFLPPALYDDREPDRELLLDRGHAEKRIPVYEGMMNPVDGPPKVRFPADIETPGEAVDRIAADRTIVPAEIEAGQRFDDEFVHLRHKHGSYWRWVRPVFDGATAGSANARIEFRPLPGQPTLPDTIAFLAVFAGLMTAFHERDHPVRGLPWEQARENFRAAARDGLGADLVWITADGERTTDHAVIFSELLELATEGLTHHGFSTQQADAWVDPLRERVETGRTPAAWKRQYVASRLEDGLSVPEAVRSMQQAYIDHQAETLFAGNFAEWPDPG
jgi:hypothetical protein